MPPPGQPHRDFKGVFIPKEIWLASDLSIQEKALFVEIHSLDNENGCYASNAHFARFLGCSDRSVQNYLRKLLKRGYVRIDSNKQRLQTGGYIDYRVIRTAGKYARHPDRKLMEVEFVTNENQVRVARLHFRRDDGEN